MSSRSHLGKIILMLLGLLVIIDASSGRKMPHIVVNGRMSYIVVQGRRRVSLHNFSSRAEYCVVS
jgi:hypothetical protein